MSSNFSFNFTFAENQVDEKIDQNFIIYSDDTKKLPILLSNCVEVIAKKSDIHQIQFQNVQIFGKLFKKVNNIYDYLYSDYDLIPGKYEGGLKLWEGSIDLVSLLLSDSKFLSFQDGSPKKVLELGCGHGLPGICALALGHSVLFSDFNSEVLDLTWCNILLNCYEFKENARCISGDWLALSERLNDRKYDSKLFSLILSAETLYNDDSCRRIAYMIENHLEENGIALVASKRYYFGVGGGTDELRKLISSNISFQVLATFEDGSSNIREIIQLQRLKR